MALNFLDHPCCKILQQRLRTSLGGNTRTPTPTAGGQDKRDYQDSRFMQNVLYGSVPAQKTVYHQRSVSSAPLAEQFGGSRKSHVHQRETPGASSAQRCGDRAVSAFVVPSGMPSQSQFGSRASQMDYRGISPTNSQKSMSNEFPGFFFELVSQFLWKGIDPNGCDSKLRKEID
ncbi:unnamed protein product [Cylicostephanus goldi]|uniref:Uncharacterized protein n=1 Tax=Cylicostephanus goldi TaxID=71465 RepID=A0A3P7N3E4_CYLGO|nr:unnamed protein product [Cylicostephanus goldi]